MIMNVKKKLYLMNFLTVVVPIVMISIATYIIFSEKIKDLGNEKIDLVDASIKEKIVSSIDSMDEMLDYLISTYTDGDKILKEVGREPNDKNREWRMLRHTKNLADIEKVIKYIGYGNAQKSIFLSKKSEKMKLPSDYDPTKENWYIGALDAENYYLSDISLDKTTNEPVMTISRKIVSEGKVAGVVYFIIDVNEVLKNLSQYKIGENGSFYIINKNKEIVVRSKKVEKDYEYIKDMDLYNIENYENNHFEIIKDTPNGEVFYHLSKIDELGLIIIANVEYDDFYSSVYILRDLCIIVVVMAVIVALIGLWIFGKKFDESLKRLSYVINSISNGNYTKDIDALTNVIDENSELNFIRESIKTMNGEIVKRETELKFIAETDVLTRIYNRRAIMSFIESELQSFKNFGSEFTLIMFDLDKFKRLNDKFGHQFGDTVLKEVCSVLSKNISKNDKFGRYGGEEFLILLPKTELADGIKISEKLRKLVEEIKWEEEVQVTISMGVVRSMKNESLDIVLNRVDNLLYKAKDNGRNRVEAQKVINKV
jgi:diguanylate cyclase (GGDEF)-like protein